MRASDLDQLLPAPAPAPELLPRWGTVTQQTPLRVRLDGDPEALPITPTSLVPSLTVGMHVFCLLAGRSLIIVGGVGGGGIPAGTISAYGGVAAPMGWLLCQGQLVSRTTYAALFAAIGNTYGAGDGSTTFAVPDLRGRVPAGADSGDADFALGHPGGTKTVTLTVDQIPSHTHRAPSGSFGIVGAGGTYGVVANPASGINGDYSATGSRGGGQAHNNLQPYLAVNYIVKV